MPDPLTVTNPNQVPVSKTGSNELNPAELSDVVLDDSQWSSVQFSPSQTAESHSTTEKSGKPSDSRQVEETSVDENDKKPLKTGKVLALVYPTNQHCAWISPPAYSFEKIPNALNTKDLTVASADYKRIMYTISADIRFKSYCVMFSRIVPIWIMTSVILLMFMLLASQDGGLHVMVFTLLWCLMLCIGMGFCVLIRKYLVHGLNLVVRDANDLALKHNLLVGVQDRGQLSCHKVVIVLMYYEGGECQNDIKRLIRVHLANQPVKGDMPEEKELDDQAREFIIEHSQPYIKAYAKKQLLFPTKPSEGVSEFRPKHCNSSICICQYVEQKVFQNMPLLS